MRGSGRHSPARIGCGCEAYFDVYDPGCVQKRCYTQSIQPGGHIVEDDAPAFGEAFELAGGKGLGDIEEAKENKSDEGVTPVEGAEEQRDPLAGDFVDDHEFRIVAAALARDDGGGGNAEDDR